MKGWGGVKQKCKKGARRRHIQGWICSGSSGPSDCFEYSF